MTLINKFDAQSIETISRIIGSIMTGSTITKMLEQLNIEDNRIRKMTGINLDGNRLIYTCFDLKYPIIVFNSLKTDTEKNLYSGLKNILLSIAQIGRNPKAHTPKIYSYDSLDNCLDILNLISFSHKMLDQCSINQFALDEFMKSN